uniref:Cytochrome P450 n=1 Tax=Phaedon brassicae TaxID=154011 RepID=A0A9Y1PPM2_9CUCU|nr:cytochrome P450 [Phaedon brassicae]
MMSTNMWLAIIALTIFYYFCVRPMKYWRKIGVHQGHPSWLFGDNSRNIFGLECFITTIDKGYKNAPDKRYFGMYMFVKPLLVVKDPDLIKEITVKSFDNFADHRDIMPVEADPLWGKNLVQLKGEDWKFMRPLMSPSFTSGKIKTMYGLMSDCAKNFVNHFKNRNEMSIELNVLDATTRYTNDVIASVAFGVAVDSLKNPDNEFFQVAKRATDLTKFWVTLSAFASFILPGSIMKMLGLRFFEEDVRNYFFKVLQDSLQMRKNSGTYRSDLIDSLLEAQSAVRRDNSSRQLNDDDILAQSMIFFLGGFDTVSKLLGFIYYELAINKEVQDKLRKEILEVSRGSDGNITYEAIMKMEYMDMVISESLRKWPIMGGIDRICTKSYKIEAITPDERTIIIEKGTQTWIPVWSIHHDANYFPEPEKFDPERFNEERKKEIYPYAYNPFGFGPRSCIGQRFSLLKCKILIMHIISNFELEPCQKTKIPLGLFKKAFLVNPEVDIFVNMKKIS